MSLWLEFGLNAFVAVLLAATLIYCVVLNKRIRMLQDSRGELSELLKHFDESTTRASESIMALQAASKKIGETIQARIERANYAIDDLSFLLERANHVADSMEAGIAIARQREKLAAPAAPRRERVLEEEAAQVRAKPKPERVEPEAPARTLASLQAMLEKVVKRDEEEKKVKKTRSDAEKELLEMLRTSKV